MGQVGQGEMLHARLSHLSHMVRMEWDREKPMKSMLSHLSHLSHKITARATGLRPFSDEPRA